MPHMKAMNVPFQLMYGRLICSKGLESERPKWRGMLAKVSRASLCNTVSKTFLEWCENWRCLSFLPVIWLFLWVGQAIIPHLKEDIQGYLLIKNQDDCPTDRYFMIMFWSPAEVYKWRSTSWSLTMWFLGVYSATIYPMKGDKYSFHMRHGRLICCKR